jgi:hypothetical protein
MRRETLARMVVGAAAVGAAVAGYTRAIRPWHVRWGATDSEVQEPLPGDEVIPHPELQATHALTIQAPVADVWPWLVQVGQDRGGFYSYSWLENLVGCELQNADRILLECQTLKVGDSVRLHPKAPPLPVLVVQPSRAIVLGGSGERSAATPGAGAATSPTVGTWGFFLKEVDAQTTRLTMRCRWRRSPGLLSWAYNYLLLEPAHFVMERKMMLGIKARAEALAARSAKQVKSY